MRTSCNGCRILRKGCSDDCLIRPCLEWIISSDSQANATLFLAKFYGRAGLLNLLAAGPSHLRPAMFRSLLYDACGRIMDPINGATGLMISGQWYQCQVAVDCVMRGVPIIRNPHHLTITSDDSQPTPSSIPTLSSSLPWVDIRHVSNSRKLLMTSSPHRSSNHYHQNHQHPGSSSSTSIRPLCGGGDAAGAGPSTQIEELMMMSTDHHHHHHHTSGGGGGTGVVNGCGCGGCGETNQMEYSWCCNNNNNNDQDDLDLESGGVNHHDQMKLEHMNKETEQMEESSSIGDKGSGEEDIVGLDLTLGFKL